MREIRIEPTFESWQHAARLLLRDDVPPGDVAWREVPVGEAPPPGEVTDPNRAIRVPRAFVDLARGVAIHRDPVRWPLLYEVLWRLLREGRALMQGGDPSVDKLVQLERDVRENRAVITAAPFVPGGASLAALAAAASRCAGCELSRHASQTVFGRGPANARIVLVGEQPGDQEDRQGAPFVGPAGEVLDRALAEVGLDRGTLYVTNAVKHFKYTRKGPRRIHQTPGPADIAACRPWIEAELEQLRPEMLVCLGATASRALINPGFRLLQQHGTFLETRWAARTLATIHPSAVLRGEGDDEQARLYAMLRDDLRVVAQSRPTVDPPKETT
ncbi:MAG TPA: UdgX family uracil-DNA binding protein [Terriglobales bacterium]|nr:UdgX family uracil-DNA binding protein [Terriglobales bacterium]